MEYKVHSTKQALEKCWRLLLQKFSFEKLHSLVEKAGSLESG